MHCLMKLTKTVIKAAIREVRATRKRKLLSDGLGLALLITPTGQHWKFRFRLNEKPQTLSFGPWPEVFIEEARELCIGARKSIRMGEDPRLVKKRARLDAAKPSFQSVAEEYFVQRVDWSESHRKKTRNRVAKDAFLSFGNIRVDEVTLQDVRFVLERVEARTVADSAQKLLRAINQILNYAQITGYISFNPADGLSKALRRPVKGNFNYVADPMRLGAILNAIDCLDGCTETVKALARLQPLLFCRPKELRELKWAEVNLHLRQIEISTERMTKVRHGALIIPLSTQALEILEGLVSYTGHTPYVFASTRRDRKSREYKPLSGGALDTALQKAGISPSEQHPHGFRHTASTLLNEAGVNRDWIECQLHHIDGSVRGVYNKAEYLENRREMMQMYSNMLTGFKEKSCASEIPR